MIPLQKNKRKQEGKMSDFKVFSQKFINDFNYLNKSGVNLFSPGDYLVPSSLDQTNNEISLNDYHIVIACDGVRYYILTLKKMINLYKDKNKLDVEKEDLRGIYKTTAEAMYKISKVYLLDLIKKAIKEVNQ